MNSTGRSADTRAPQAGDRAPQAGDRAALAGDRAAQAGDRAPQAGDRAPQAARAAPAASWLICRVGDRAVALPLASVLETMRPLPVLALPDVPALPPFLSGMSVVRDEAVPVVSLGAMLGGSGSGSAIATAPARFVTIAQGDRTLALAVDEVLGVRALDGADLRAVPPLLGALESDALAAVGTLDAGLLLVLGDARLVPDAVWAAVPAAGQVPA